MEADFNNPQPVKSSVLRINYVRVETHQQVHTPSKLDEIIIINITILDASFDFKVLQNQVQGVRVFVY